MVEKVMVAVEEALQRDELGRVGLLHRVDRVDALRTKSSPQDRQRIRVARGTDDSAELRE